MGGRKMKGLYTDKKDSWQHEEVSRKHKILFKEMAQGQVCKYTIAQVMMKGKCFVTVDHCMLKLFGRTYKSLSKKERKVIDFAYSIAEADYWHYAKKLLLIDPKFGNNIKVATDMGGTSGGSSERQLRITIRAKE